MTVGFREGDFVLHNPSGEKWILKRVIGEYVEPAGWPPCQAKASDCTLIKRDDGTLDRLRGMGGDHKRSAE